MMEERKAYHMKTYTTSSIEKFFVKFNYNTQEELKSKRLLYDFQGLSKKFEEIVTINNVVATLVDGEYLWKDIM